MHISILLPHYKVGKITAYAVSRILKYSGTHELDIIVIDNNAGDGSLYYLEPFLRHITILEYPKDKMQSHGIAFDFAIPNIRTEWFIAVESDSFPTEDNWIDYYEHLILEGYDGAGSLLRLSGGQYTHPAGALYKKSIWEEAKRYCDTIDYAYLPNIAMKEGFPCHLMVRNKIFTEFCKNPESFVELHHSYNGNTPLMISEKSIGYEPVTKPFHNGMGQFQESYSTYALRNTRSEPDGIILKHDIDLIFRMGYEPGQWFCYYMIATGRALFNIPTKTIWMPNRRDQQQEYTIMENGFKHCWGVSAYNGCTADDVQDIVKRKERLVDELYDSM